MVVLSRLIGGMMMERTTLFVVVALRAVDEVGVSTVKSLSGIQHVLRLFVRHHDNLSFSTTSLSPF